MTHDIESQLAALKPTGQPTLARRILDIPHRKRQRRRDCFVALGGLLTGIVATVLVMMFSHGGTEESAPLIAQGVPPSAPLNFSPTREEGRETEETSVLLRAQNPVIPAHPVIPAKAGIQTNDKRLAVLDPRLCVDGDIADPLDLDVWIARYEKLLRHRQMASRTVYIPPVTPPVLPDGMSPLEYRQTLLTELGG